VPRKRLTVRKIREVLRLKAAGLNIRQVAASTGAARTTVYEYLVRAEDAGLSWPLPEGLDDAALEARPFPPATAELAKLRPVPEWREVHKELRSGKHVTFRLLWLEWKEGHPAPQRSSSSGMLVMLMMLWAAEWVSKRKPGIVSSVRDPPPATSAASRTVTASPVRAR
jgi:transposase